MDVKNSLNFDEPMVRLRDCKQVSGHLGNVGKWASGQVDKWTSRATT